MNNGMQVDEEPSTETAPSHRRMGSLQFRLVVIVALLLVAFTLCMVVLTATSIDAEARGSLVIRVLALGAGFTVVGSLATHVLAGRLTRPILAMTDAAERLANVLLPGLVERLRTGDMREDERFEPIAAPSGNEAARLAESINAVQVSTAAVARQQREILSSGIGDIFVQLARRNQSLIDRQLEVIDQLEASERSPDALAGLFKLDHLAARMRRNAESLLVLADEGQTNVRARPVTMTEVVRTAIGEVEQYHRIEVLDVAPMLVRGSAAPGLAHLIAELFDNSLRNSPETTRVDVTGTGDTTGYVIEIMDYGVGLSPEKLAECNDHIRNPPPVSLRLARSLGLTVVGRLAEQYELTVELHTNEHGGVAARIAVPPALLRSSAGPLEGTRQAPTAPPPPAPVDQPQPVAAAPQPAAATPETIVVPPQPMVEASQPVATAAETVVVSPQPASEATAPAQPAQPTEPAEPAQPIEPAESAESADPQPVAATPPPSAEAEPSDAPAPLAPRRVRGATPPVSAPGPAASTSAAAVSASELAPRRERNAQLPQQTSTRARTGTRKPLPTRSVPGAALAAAREHAVPAIIPASPSTKGGASVGPQGVSPDASTSTSPAPAPKPAASAPPSPPLVKRPTTSPAPLASTAAVPAAAPTPDAPSTDGEPPDGPGLTDVANRQPSRRSPDQVRSVLSNYRSGRQRGAEDTRPDAPGDVG